MNWLRALNGTKNAELRQDLNVAMFLFLQEVTSIVS